MSRLEEIRAAIDSIKPSFLHYGHTCSSWDVFGPISLSELRDQSGLIDLASRKGIYIIWGNLNEARPLYIGKSLGIQGRLLGHLAIRSSGGQNELQGVFGYVKPLHLSWPCFLCPVVKKRKLPRSLILSDDAALGEFERDFVAALDPWIWHGGLRTRKGDEIIAPWYIQPLIAAELEAKRYRMAHPLKLVPMVIR